MASSTPVIASKPLTSAQCLVTLTRYLDIKNQHDLMTKQRDQIRSHYNKTFLAVEKMYAECRRRIGSRYIDPMVWNSWSDAEQNSYRAETVGMTEAILGGTVEALKEKFCKRNGLPYPMPNAIATESSTPPHYNIALSYQTILEQFKISDVAEIQRSAIINTDTI